MEIESINTNSTKRFGNLFLPYSFVTKGKEALTEKERGKRPLVDVLISQKSVVYVDYGERDS